MRSLREEWDEIDAKKQQADALTVEVEDDGYALGKRLSDAYAAGRGVRELAREPGRAPSTVSVWISAYRKHGDAVLAGERTWSQALALARGDAPNTLRGVTKSEGIVRSRGRSALQQQPEVLAPEIAKAMEKPEVAEKVIAAMPAEVKAAVAKAITPAPLTPQPLVQMPPPRSEAEKAAEKAEGATSGRRASGCNGRAPGPPDRRCRPWRHGSRGRRSGRRR